MRKFFLALSVFVLVSLISLGVHQKVERSSVKDIKAQEVGVIYSNYILK